MATIPANTSKEPNSFLLSLHPCQSLDCTSLVQALASTLDRGLHSNCVCCHPDKPLVALGASGLVAIFDLLSASRLCRLDLKSTPVDLRFSPDGFWLVVATQDWTIYAISLSSFKIRVLVPRRIKVDKQLDSCLLAAAPGRTPSAFFAKYGGEVLRSATLIAPPNLKASTSYLKKAVGVESSSGTGTSGSSWGHRMKLDVSKPILALACHPRDSQVVVLHADGVLRGYLAVAGADVPSPLFAVPVMDSPFKSLPAAGTLEFLPHPSNPGSAFILVAPRLKGHVVILEVSQRSAPTQHVRTALPGWEVVLGMGIAKDAGTIVAVGLCEGHTIRASAWKIESQGGARTLALTSMRVEPQDLSPLLAAGNGSSTVSPAAAATAAVTAADVTSAGTEDASMVTSLWSGSEGDGWAQGISPTVLLDPLLAPLVAKAAVHPSLGVIVFQHEPPLEVQALPGLQVQPRGSLTAEELNLARRSSTLPVLALISRDAHFSGWRPAMLAPLNTPLSTWVDPVGPLRLPCHAYYLSAGGLVKYGLATRDAREMVSLPRELRSGTAMLGYMLAARHVMHSSVHGAWLVFFEQPTAPTLAERWQWALVNAAALPKQPSDLTLRSGKYGVFVGREDSYTAILDANGRTLLVFVTPSLQANPSSPPMYTISLDNSSTPSYTPPSSSVLGATLFPGPPTTTLPRTPASTGGMQPNKRERRAPKTATLGPILWQTQDGRLMVASLPNPGVGSVSASTADFEPRQSLTVTNMRLGVLAAEASLALQPGEQVLHVAWQALDLQADLMAGAVSPAPTGLYAAAVLTSQRVMIVRSDLAILAAVSVGGSMAVHHPVTSVVWAGPVLLYCTAAGQVVQLTWSGATHQLCTFSPHGATTALLGATADSLLLLRASVDGTTWEPANRPVSMLQPLLLGWASLGSAGLLGVGAQGVRAAMKKTLTEHDCSHVSPRLLWSLLEGGCGDVACALALHSSQTPASVRIAAYAAAGNWSLVEAELRQEAGRAFYHPAPPPPGSAMHAKMLAAAAGALRHGALSRAQELMKLAGEWRLAAVIASCRGDFSALSELPHIATATGEEGGAARLGEVLREVYGAAATALVPDAVLQLSGPDGTPVESAGSWELGSMGCTPKAVAVLPQGVPQEVAGPDDLGPIPSTDRNTLVAYLGLGAVFSSEVMGVPRPRSISRPGSEMDGATPSFADSFAARDPGFHLGPVPSPGSNSFADFASSFNSSSHHVPPQLDAQEAARAAFMSGQQGLDSSDDDEDAGSRQKKFQIKIRSKDFPGTNSSSTLPGPPSAFNWAGTPPVLQPPPLGAPPPFPLGTTTSAAIAPPPSNQSGAPFDNIFGDDFFSSSTSTGAQPWAAATGAVAATATALPTIAPPTAAIQPRAQPADPFGFDDGAWAATADAASAAPSSGALMPRSQPADSFGFEEGAWAPATGAISAPTTALDSTTGVPLSQPADSFGFHDNAFEDSAFSSKFGEEPQSSNIGAGQLGSASLEQPSYASSSSTLTSPSPSYADRHNQGLTSYPSDAPSGVTYGVTLENQTSAIGFQDEAWPSESTFESYEPHAFSTFSTDPDYEIQPSAHDHVDISLSQNARMEIPQNVTSSPAPYLPTDLSSLVEADEMEPETIDFQVVDFSASVVQPESPQAANSYSAHTVYPNQPVIFPDSEEDHNSAATVGGLWFQHNVGSGGTEDHASDLVTSNSFEGFGDHSFTASSPLEAASPFTLGTTTSGTTVPASTILGASALEMGTEEGFNDYAFTASSPSDAIPHYPSVPTTSDPLVPPAESMGMAGPEAATAEGFDDHAFGDGSVGWETQENSEAARLTGPADLGSSSVEGPDKHGALVEGGVDRDSEILKEPYFVLEPPESTAFHALDETMPIGSAGSVEPPAVLNTEAVMTAADDEATAVHNAADVGAPYTDFNTDRATAAAITEPAAEPAISITTTASAAPTYTAAVTTHFETPTAAASILSSDIPNASALAKDAVSGTAFESQHSGPGTADAPALVALTADAAQNQYSRPGAAAVEAGSAPTSPPQPELTSVDLYRTGVACMEEGDWVSAAMAFSKALARLHVEPPGPSTPQRVSFCAQYYAAVRLMMAISTMPTPSTTRLYRYASALRLADPHRVALAREATERNKAEGNLRYSAQQLLLLAQEGYLEFPAEALAALAIQAENGPNVSVPDGEDIAGWVASISQSKRADEVETLLRDLLI